MIQFLKQIHTKWSNLSYTRQSILLTSIIGIACFFYLAPENRSELLPSWLAGLSLAQVCMIMTLLSVLIQVPLPRFLARQSLPLINILPLIIALNVLAFLVAVQFRLVITPVTSIFLVLVCLVPFWASIGLIWSLRTSMTERILLLVFGVPYSLVCFLFFTGLVRLSLYLNPTNSIILIGASELAAILACGADAYVNPPAQMVPCTLEIDYRTTFEFWLWFLGQIFSPFFLGAGFAAFGTLLLREKAENNPRP